MKNFICLVCVASAAACGPRQPDDGSEQAAVAMLAAVRPGEPLDSMLWRLDQHLVNAMSDQLEDESLIELHRAEALTDRLLEARMPFEWITGEQYSVQSRLRQIQSLADRVIAEVETMAPREQLLLDLRELRTEVVELREALTKGGTRAPPSIEELLAADSSRPPPAAAPGQADNAPAAPAAAAPLGVPVAVPVVTGG
jgi:hypothetical protein